jgi:ATP-dependent DNA helicase DinG
MLKRVPLQLGDLLQHKLFAQIRGGVLTSATLTVKGDFSYIKKHLGLDLCPEGTCREGIFASPFNFQDNVLLIIGRDLPLPEDPSYLAAVSTLLPRIIQAAGGRSLLLFTNRQQMNEVYTKIIPPLTMAGIHPLRQGDEPRHRLLQKFQTAAPCVLLGMDSFWEGIDIPGSELSNVIIMRLPFRVPTDPLFQARWEALSKEGKDPFSNLSLPEAVIKFKQGFGRLIRSQSDRGVVVILDPRLYTKRYGQVFLNSIPGGQITVASQDELAEQVEKWLSS